MSGYALTRRLGNHRDFYISTEVAMEIFTTMITPYHKDKTVDYEMARRYVDWYFDNGLTGIFAVCQSSEIFYLTLEERVALNKCVYARAKELEKQSGRPFTVVSSGHVSDTLEEQAEELNAIWESGTDALILITNRLANADESDDVWIANCEKLLAAATGITFGEEARSQA